MLQQVSSILVNLCQLLSDIYYYPGSFGVDNVSSIVIEERRLLSYIPQCTGMEERLVNCTRNNTQCEGDGGGRVVMGCWNSSRDSSQPTLPVTTHTLALQTGTITSTATVSSSVPSTVSTSVPSSSPSRTIIIPTSTNPSYASCTRVVESPTLSDASRLPLHPHVLYAVLSAIVALLLLGILLVSLCICCRRKGIRGESREMELNPAYQTTASLTSSTTNPAYQTTASLIPSTTNPAYQTTASLTSSTTNPAYQTTASLIPSITNPAYQTTASLTSSTTNPAYQTTASLISSTTNPAYHTTASLIPSTTNPAYAGLTVSIHPPHLCEDVFHCQ